MSVSHSLRRPSMPRPLFAGMSLCLQPDNLLVRLEAESRSAFLYSLFRILAGDVAVVLFNHAGVGMAQVLSDDEQRCPFHERERCPCVAQLVEPHGLEFGSLASLL